MIFFAIIANATPLLAQDIIANNVKLRAMAMIYASNVLCAKVIDIKWTGFNWKIVHFCESPT